MNCEKCHELLSDFLDGTLTGEARAAVSGHLATCRTCAAARDDVSAISAAARSLHDHTVAPPSSRALWLRINNTIEAERAEQLRAQARAVVAEARRRETFVERMLNKRWTLTLPQMAAAIVALVVGVATFTVFGVRGLRSTERPVAPQVTERRNIEDQELNFLMQRIEQRKSRWNPRMRESFERNLQVIDAALSDSLQHLDQSPHDVVSEDALDAAMRNKKELLREFSRL
jgi:predicted anti-sigma-YlaC factor YlaD